MLQLHTLLVASWASVSAATQFQCPALDVGTDYFGNDLQGKNKKTDTMEDCCSLCSSIQECNAVTWNNGSDHNCNLKHSSAGKRKNSVRL